MNYQLLQGDCIQVLQTLPAASVHCVVTSPPYFGLRDYGHEGQIGLEQTPSEYVQKLVDVFREVRRVLRDDGTVWLNLGDSFANDGKWGGHTGGKHVAELHGQAIGRAKRDTGLKPKDLIGIPWRVAFALQADGWWLRSDIIWAKPNGMPESVTDRPTRSHEYLFLLAKSERYYYDAQAIAEPAQFWAGQAGTFERTGPVSQHVLPGQSAAQHRTERAKGKAGKNSFRGQGAEREGATGPANRDGRDLPDVGYGPTRNKRSVWTVATRPYPEAHFATYPVELVQPCIMAGTSAHGCCAVCGAPWVRVVEREFIPQQDVRDPAKLAKGSNKGMDASNGWGDTPRGTVSTQTTGWEPSCTCSADVVPCSVLDPFNGAGSTGVAAIGLGRRYTGIDINPDYLDLAHERLGRTQPALFAV